ncbi:MAG: hypothetical protein QOI11_2133, partial [Candidatus Eremiobacteraeota bacterium]|nr:hypothetical protein [Candidatus Eremiobacteraeota bacterium]
MAFVQLAGSALYLPDGTDPAAARLGYLLPAKPAATISLRDSLDT